MVSKTPSFLTTMSSKNISYPRSRDGYGKSESKGHYRYGKGPSSKGPLLKYRKLILEIVSNNFRSSTAVSSAFGRHLIMISWILSLLVLSLMLCNCYNFFENFSVTENFGFITYVNAKTSPGLAYTSSTSAVGSPGKSVGPGRTGRRRSAPATPTINELSPVAVTALDPFSQSAKNGKELQKNLNGTNASEMEAVYFLSYVFLFFFVCLFCCLDFLSQISESTVHNNFSIL